MSMHTPGPWELGGTLASGQHCVIGEGDTVVALMPDETMYCTYRPADARLIAAAPELLESAIKALEIAESWIHDQLDGTTGLDKALSELDSVRETIDNATRNQL